MAQLFTNGKIFTAQNETDFATALRLDDGRISWVGDGRELSPAQLDSAVDLEGRTVLPGLLDMHVHPALMANTADAVECLPPRVQSVTELIAALRTHPRYGAGKSDWIVGAGYDETKYYDGAPTARDLDEISRTQPVLVWRADRHTALCNTRALELAGVTSHTPDPEGGRFGRYSDGTPNGVLEEFSAISTITEKMPERTAEERADLLEMVGRRLFSRGIVGVCDLLATTIPDPLETYRTVAERTPFPRAALFLGWKRPHDLDELTEQETVGTTRVAGAKVLMDGAYSNRTAWVCSPYPGSDEYGLRTLSDQELVSAAEWARRNGVQLAVHAMGDRAISHTVDVLADMEPWLEGTPSVRIEHATLMSATLTERLSSTRMRFGIATHTIFFYSEYEAYEKNLRPEQITDAYPVRPLYDSVDALALSSDCPATAWSEADNVFVSIEAAVRRRAYTGAQFGQEAAITVPQAVLLYTARAAGVTALPGLGQLAEGYEGSFVVLDQDIFTIPVEQIAQTRVLQTWQAGKLVHAS